MTTLDIFLKSGHNARLLLAKESLIDPKNQIMRINNLAVFKEIDFCSVINAKTYEMKAFDTMQDAINYALKPQKEKKITQGKLF